jgi:RNA polymerase sigma factor (sigma-70 family)
MAPTAIVAATADLVRHARGREDARAGAKDPAVAFAALVRRFERTALAVAFACCGDAALAGDITQEAFLRAWRRLADLSDEAKFGPWLCGIVRHLSADARRRGIVRHAIPLDMAGAADVAEPVSRLDRMEQADMINWALRQLDEISRTAVVLRYYENLSSAQIAELIDATPAAVDMRLSRARRTLRELLKQGSHE